MPKSLRVLDLLLVQCGGAGKRCYPENRPGVQDGSILWLKDTLYRDPMKYCLLCLTWCHVSCIHSQLRICNHSPMLTAHV